MKSIGIWSAVVVAVYLGFSTAQAEEQPFNSKI